MLDIYPFVRYDNFLSGEDSDLVYKECQFKTSYFYGERDSYPLPPTGMVTDIKPGNLIYDLITKKINDEL